MQRSSAAFQINFANFNLLQRLRNRNICDLFHFLYALHKENSGFTLYRPVILLAR